MTKKIVIPSLIALLVSLAGPVVAEDWSDAQKEVWQTVLMSYKDIEAQDAKWSEKWVLKDAKVWGNSYPMPRGRDSIKRWDEYNFGNSKTLVSEYAPAAVVVHGSTAVAHYYYSSASENKEGKRETTHGRCSDVLAKDGKSWRFIAWHCADEPSDD